MQPNDLTRTIILSFTFGIVLLGSVQGIINLADIQIDNANLKAISWLALASGALLGHIANLAFSQRHEVIVTNSLPR